MTFEAKGKNNHTFVLLNLGSLFTTSTTPRFFHLPNKISCNFFYICICIYACIYTYTHSHIRMHIHTHVITENPKHIYLCVREICAYIDDQNFKIMIVKRILRVSDSLSNMLHHERQESRLKIFFVFCYNFSRIELLTFLH